jgi:ribosomal protein S18 acetylase RimI-like enzyme
MCFVIEPGRPEEAAQAARLIAETDRDLFTSYAGDLAAWVEISEHEWRHERGIYCYRMADVVRDGAALRGLLISYSGRAPLEIDWSLGNSAPHISPAVMAQVQRSRRRVHFLFPAIPEDVWYVQNIAVVAEGRGGGLGRFLMNAAEERATATGCVEVHLDVDSSAPAVGFYRRLGYEVLVETRVPGLPAVHTHYRMVKAIRPPPPDEGHRP